MSAARGSHKASEAQRFWMGGAPEILPAHHRRPCPTRRYASAGPPRTLRAAVFSAVTALSAAAAVGVLVVVPFGRPLALARYGDLLVPFALVGAPRGRVVAARQGGEFALQLQVAGPPAVLQDAVGERRLHGTAGLPAVRAVREAAVLEELFEVAEHLLHSSLGVEDPEAAHPRCVHQDGAAGQGNERAGSGGVPALAVARPHCPRLLGRDAGE